MSTRSHEVKLKLNAQLDLFTKIALTNHRNFLLGSVTLKLGKRRDHRHCNAGNEQGQSDMVNDLRAVRGVPLRPSRPALL
jgi:hypothetical protein